MSTVDAMNSTRAHRPLCAYSPRWLSGPTPSYEGLVATATAGPSEEDVPAPHTSGR